MKKFIIGAAIGTVVGGVTALLTAPKKGKDVRSSIQTQAKQVVRKTNALSETVKAKWEASKKKENEAAPAEAFSSSQAASVNEGTVRQTGNRVTVSVVSDQ